MRQEIGNRRRESGQDGTGERRHNTGDRCQQTGNSLQETADRRQEIRLQTEEGRQATGDGRLEMVPTKLGQTILFCSFTYYREKFGEFGGFSELPNYTYLFIISFLIPLRSMGSKTPMLPVPKRQSVVFFHVHVHIILSKKVNRTD